jgi:hypothetical protein
MMTDKNDNLEMCDWCSEDHNPDESENNGNVAARHLCTDCQEDAYTCYHCNEIEHSDNISWVNNGYSVCEQCLNHNYTWCDTCGEYYRYGCDDHEGDVWNDNYNSNIHDYGYQPSPNFYVREIETNRIVRTNKTELIKDTPFMGFELEIEVNNNDRSDTAAELLSNNSDWLYCKYDGSLDHGFEIVSHPHTLTAYNLRKWDWITTLKDNGCTSWHTGTCGLHVHINKSAFENNGHIWKFTNLILYNRNQATRLAGRKDNQWSSFYKEYKKVGKVLKGELDPQRYSAVNLMNYRTIEVRMFRGSLHEPRVRAALEFVNANFEYTKTLTSHDVLKNDAMSWWSFTEWAVSNESTYPHLTHYLNKIKERSDRVSTML